MLRKILKLGMIIICMGTIFMFSSDNALESSKKSNLIVDKISTNFFWNKLSKEKKNKYTNFLIFIVRKSAHFLIYLILGLLMISFITEFGVIDYKCLLLAIFLSFLYACSDEVHQLFVVGRSGEIRDVLLDTFGAVIGCFVYIGINKLRRREYE